MKKITKTTLKKNITNFFGALGYLLCALQWFFVVIVYANTLKDLLTTNTPVPDYVPQAVPVVANTSTNPAFAILAGLVSVGVIVFAVYMLLKIPKTIIKTGKKVIHEVAERTAPVVLRIQHVEQRKQTPKRVRKVTEYLVIAIKALFIAAPLVLVFCSQFADKQILEFTTTLSIGLVLAAATILFFALQFVVGRILVVPRQNVW